MLPTHIGIIMDGNRRFAKYIMKRTPWKGYSEGAKKVHEVLSWIRDLGIHYTTLYSFSIENFNRPKKEFKMIMNVLRDEFRNIIENPENDVHKYKVKINIIGRIHMLPMDIQQLIKDVEKKTMNYKNYFINLAIAYGGRAEIVDAFKKIAKKLNAHEIKINDINEDTIRENLYTNGFPDPDMIIRTSEQRLSGFLLWQSAYSEFIFIPKFFPELTKQDFMNAIREFENRERRFGR